MAIIPTFNNLDLMEDVRVKSLNPVITAVNDLVTKSSETVQLSGTFKENEVPRWDATTQKFEPSGVLADKGEVHMAPSTLYFGNHSMSSNVENVLFTNAHTGRAYAPVWQEVAAGVKEASMRAYGSIQVDQKIPLGSFDVTNPVNKDLVANSNWSFLGMTIWVSQPATNVRIEVYDNIEGTLVWHQDVGNLSPGEKDITFRDPIDFRKTFVYDIHILSTDGSPVVLKSNQSTGFSFTLNRAQWEDLKIATQDWVKSQSTEEDAKPLLWGPGRQPPYNANNIDLKNLNPTDYVDKTLISVGNSYQRATLPPVSTSGLEPGDILTFVNMIEVDGLWMTVAAATGQTIGGRSVINVPKGRVLRVRVPYVGTSWIPLIQPTEVPTGIQGDASAGSESMYGSAHTMEPIVQMMAEPGMAQISDSDVGGKTLILKDTSVKQMDYDPATGELTVTGMNNKVTKVNISQGPVDAFVFKGKVAPTYPTTPRNPYFLSFDGIPDKSLTIKTPNPTGGIRNGTLVFINNIDATSSIKVVGDGATIEGGASINVPADNQTLLLAYDSTSKAWVDVFSGYIPFALFNLLSAVHKKYGDTWWTQDQLNTMIKSAFQDPTNIATLAAALEKLGFAKKGSGGGSVIPPSTASAYAMYSASPTAPDTLPQGLPVFRDGTVSVHKDTDDGQYVYLFVPPGEEHDANKVAEAGGLPSLWAKESKVYGNLTYTVFRSPYKYHERDATFTIYP